jgi:transcriptional regulator with XRE-family HTH domain
MQCSFKAEGLHCATGYSTVVETMVALRGKARLTQQEFADRLGRHRSFVWKIEGGEMRMDLVEFIQRCRACGADPERVFAAVAAAVPKRA